ncbi:MAG: hypothetical protein KBD54_02825 [Candidatus Pacebacteria bacterium]|nr:hypothetical protein [Candidatus Paceibacterota bacterium]
MAKTQFNEKKQSLSYRRLFGAMLALLFFFILLTSVISVAGKYFRIKAHIKELNQEKAILSAKHEALLKTNAYLATPEGQEQALRDKYNVVKPGEGMIVIVPAQDPEVPARRPSVVVRWWNSIIHGLGFGADQ